MRITHRRAVSVSTFVDVSACRYSGMSFPNTSTTQDTPFENAEMKFSLKKSIRFSDVIVAKMDLNHCFLFVYLIKYNHH